eukprot:RCo023177
MRLSVVPNDTLEVILKFLDASTLTLSGRVCQRWTRIYSKLLSNVIRAICVRQQWYHKMKDSAILTTWRVEAKEQGIPGVFELALDKLQKDSSSSIDGIVVVDNVVPVGLRDALIQALDVLAEAPEKDFHPGSEGKVQNLIHPSLFPYIEGVSVKHCSSHPRSTSATALDAKSPFNHCIDVKVQPSAYQWLPSEVDVDSDGNARFLSYINNLDFSTHAPLYRLLEDLLTISLPLMESAFLEALGNEGRDVSLRNRRIQVIVKAANYLLNPGESYDGKWHVEGLPQERIVCTCIHYYHTAPPLAISSELCFRRILDETRDPEENGGHYDDYSHTPDPCEYEDEEEYNKAAQRHAASSNRWSNRTTHYTQENNTFVQRTDTPMGRSIAFVNSLQHQVHCEYLAPPTDSELKSARSAASEAKKFLEEAAEAERRRKRPFRGYGSGDRRKAEGKIANLKHLEARASIPPGTPGVRKIVLFWLVHPDHPIVSTAEVDPQQNLMDTEVAKQHRVKMLADRTQHINAVNEEFEREVRREYNFCEH